MYRERTDRKIEDRERERERERGKTHIWRHVPPLSPLVLELEADRRCVLRWTDTRDRQTERQRRSWEERDSTHTWREAGRQRQAGESKREVERENRHKDREREREEKQRREVELTHGGMFLLCPLWYWSSKLTEDVA